MSEGLLLSCQQIYHLAFLFNFYKFYKFFYSTFPFLKFLVNFTLLKYVKSQNFGFKRSLLSLLNEYLVVSHAEKPMASTDTGLMLKT